jgi:DNA mismatch repair protein MutS2
MFLDETTAILLGWHEVLELLSRQAVTPQGRAFCRSVNPSTQLEEIHRAQERCRQLALLLDQGISPPIESIDKVADELARAKKQGVLTPEEVQSIGRAMLVSSRVRHFLLNQDHRTAPKGTPNGGGALTDLARDTHDLSSAGRDFVDAFDETGELRDTASPDLGPLRREARALADKIRTRLERMMRSSKVAACLHEPYITQRGNRYVLPVRADAHDPLPGIVHDTSQSGATLFIEPADLVENGNRLKIAQAAAAKEERRILSEYTQEIAEQADRLEDNLTALAKFDFVLASVRLGRKLRARLIEVGGDGFHLLQARHPLMCLKSEEVVPNDIRLADRQHCLVVTGPNAGGKTVALKTVGLIAIMAHAGLFVPAQEGSRIGLFSNLHAVIGDAQDINRGLSTFSAHVERIGKILRHARRSTLVLLDELTADTDPGHGAALARSILESLAENGVTTMVTTHLEELKHLAYQDEQFANTSVGFDLETLKPTYILHPDVPGRSLTLDIARNLGIDRKVIARAKRYLDGSERQIDSLLESLEEERQHMVELRAQFERRSREMETQAQKHARAFAELSDSKKELLDLERSAVFEEIKKMRQEVAGIIENLKGNPSMKAAVEASQRLKGLQCRLEEQKKTHPQNVDEQRGKAVKPQDLREGDRVLVTILGQEGEITSVDRHSGMVSVNLGALRTRVAVEQVRRLDAPGGAKKRRRKKGPYRTPSAAVPTARSAALEVLREPAEVRTSANTLDLRGLRVDEALDEVDKFLDQVFGSSEAAAFLIHGHGTGALKAAVRDYLKKSPYPQHFRTGTPEEGGDGITVVRLK